MPSNTKPPQTKRLSEQEIAEFESQRDLGAELLESLAQMKAGQDHVIYSPAIQARQQMGLTQSQFAKLLGVSVRTLQGWEQGRKTPSGAARMLLNIAQINPKVLLAAATR